LSVEQSQLDQTLVAEADLAGEFAIAAVEDGDGITHRPAQHRTEVMRSTLIQGDARFGPQIGRHMKPWDHGVVDILCDRVEPGSAAQLNRFKTTFSTGTFAAPFPE
jgi:hypothetical protein